MESQTFWIPKRGNTLDEYEDAFARDEQLGRFAIADGASESSFAAQWAQLLVENYIQEPICGPEEWLAWLPSRQERWAEEVGTRPLSWYAEAKLQQGAFATLTGVSFEATGRKGRKHWSAVAVGDSCLFQVRKGRLLKSFPLTRSEQFDDSPWLVGSRSLPHRVREKTSWGTGRWQAGDQMFLMTDALACWFLRRFEAGQKPWEDLVRWEVPSLAQTDFAAWVEELRNTQGLRNDDVTLIEVYL